MTKKILSYVVYGFAGQHKVWRGRSDAMDFHDFDPEWVNPANLQDEVRRLYTEDKPNGPVITRILVCINNHQMP